MHIMKFAAALAFVATTNAFTLSPHASVLRRSGVVRRLVEEEELYASNDQSSATPAQRDTPRVVSPAAGVQFDPRSVLLISLIVVLVADDFLHFLPEGGVIKLIMSSFSGQETTQ